MNRESLKRHCEAMCRKFINVPTSDIYGEHRLVLDLLEQTEWIPVSERLPNFNDIVLASTDSDYDELRVILTVYSAEEFWFNGKIKAWMPLPEPYKAESEDKE